ncbi:hypothetical protein Dcar01_00452 [Deinococcus carri]|uniref:Intracellular proteinase inhibitor BsuPI domain-containing protein n=1 Tax=Deinococcus carri TaxID=1211323 RepID=A0ABP9W324_9DEIO
MTPRPLAALAVLLALPSAPLAQEIPPMSPLGSGTGTPVLVQPAPLPPVAAEPTPAPARPEGVTATLTAPRRVTGRVPLTLTLKSSRAVPVTFGVTHDNDQNCAFAPTVRVLRVGTREVVYPVPGASPRICTQELMSRTVPARGSTTFTRELDLPAGEYMVEGWFAGFGNKLQVKVPAQPVRVTVQ